MAKRTTSKPVSSQPAASPNCAYDLKQIREIVGLMAENDLTYFHSEQRGAKLELRRGSDINDVKDLLKSMPMTTAAPVSVAALPTAPALAVPTSAALGPATTAASAPVGPTINSPMVGTFYRSASPGEKSFVNVGDTVDENSNVCIIEAMKVMNEIKAEARGTIARVLVEDGKPVQYGQPLFELKA